jgi:ABC-type uncharacterized transport system fused permease/ATPase subunit
LEQVIIYATGVIPSKIITALTGKNQPDFQFWLLCGVIGLSTNSLIKSGKKYVASLTYIKFRSALTNTALEAYFRKVRETKQHLVKSFSI